MKDTGEETYYVRLGLHPSASVGEIRQMYRELSLRCHPDTTALEVSVAQVEFQLLSEAYATLSHPERRLQYDLMIGVSSVYVVRGLPTVMQEERRRAELGEKWQDDVSFSAYLDPEDRSFSSGELFAIFMFGVTFFGCVGLVSFLWGR